MVFVPMFDIVLGDVEHREMGSASGLLQSIQALGMALGVAVIGTVFLDALGEGTDFVAAAQVSTVVTAGLAAIAFALAFALPRHAREQLPAGAVPVPA